jgi:hypothetical protein
MKSLELSGLKIRDMAKVISMIAANILVLLMSLISNEWLTYSE